MAVHPKIRQEVKKDIVEQVVESIEKSNEKLGNELKKSNEKLGDRIIESNNETSKELGDRLIVAMDTGFHQVASIFGNVAENLSKMNKTLEKIEKKLK